MCVSLSPWCGATARPGPAPSRALLKTKILKTTGLFSCKQLSDVIFTDKNNFPEIIAENTELMVQNKIGEVACLYGSLSTVQCGHLKYLRLGKISRQVAVADHIKLFIESKFSIAHEMELEYTLHSTENWALNNIAWRVYNIMMIYPNVGWCCCSPFFKVSWVWQVGATWARAEPNSESSPDPIPN